MRLLFKGFKSLPEYRVNRIRELKIPISTPGDQADQGDFFAVDLFPPHYDPNLDMTIALFGNTFNGVNYIDLTCIGNPTLEEVENDLVDELGRQIIKFYYSSASPI